MLGRQPGKPLANAPARALWSKVTARGRALATSLVHEHADPARLGAAVALGVLIGCSPFFGVQTLVGLALAWVLKLNRLAMLLGLQISVPPLAPFVLFADAQLGNLVLHGHWLPVSVEAMRAVRGWRQVGELLGVLLLGGGIVGGILAVPAGVLTTLGIRRWRPPDQSVRP